MWMCTQGQQHRMRWGLTLLVVILQSFRRRKTLSKKGRHWKTKKKKQTNFEMTPPNALRTSSAFSKQASKQTKRQRCHVKRLKVESQYQIFLSLTYILVTKKIPSNVSVSGNAKTDSSQTRANDLANTLTTGKKRASKRVSTPTQDAEQTPLPPKKKMKASAEPSQPSATTTAMERNHGALSNQKGRIIVQKSVLLVMNPMMLLSVLI